MRQPATLVVLAAVVLLAALVAGCTGTETGNPPAAPTTLALRTSDPTIASLAPGVGVVVEEAWVSVASIRMIEGAVCDHVSLQPSVPDASGDLARGVPTDGLTAGRFCGVHLALAAGTVLPPDAPAELRGRALLVRGTSAAGAPFEVSMDAAISLELRNAAAALPVAEGDAFILTFDVARWMQGIALDSIAADPDGVRRIDGGDAVLDTFLLGLAASAELFSDANRDGVLDSAEEAAGALAGSH